MTEKRKNLKKPIQIGEIIGKVVQDFGRDADLGMIEVWKLWDNMFESPLSENTRPAAFRGKVLVVHVTSSAWIQELQFRKKDIISKINSTLGRDQVTEIKFKIGPV